MRSGWKLNKYPEVKSFLKDFEAEEYQGVEVQYVGGKPAILSIFLDGELQEEVNLFDINNKSELHSMMVEKGFVKKSDEEIEEMKKLKIKKRDEEAARIQKAREELKAKREAERERKRKEMENEQDGANVEL